MNTENVVRTVKVFVSSPADVAPERGRVQAIVAKLNREFDGLVHFETVLWEDFFYKADRSFQAQIPEPVACDVLVSIFWTRLGTELPANFPHMPNGAPYPSGTAYELLTALAASRETGAPDVYVFRKTADAVVPTADPYRRREAQTQLEALEAFWNTWFKSEKGHYKAAFHLFHDTGEFERQIEQMLRQWSKSRGLLDQRLTWLQAKGSPARRLRLRILYLVVSIILIAAMIYVPVLGKFESTEEVATARPNILDRNGEILATDQKTPSLFAEPRRILDSDGATELLAGVLPDLDSHEVRDRLASRRGFAWLKRDITPAQQQAVYRLGIPGVGFLSEDKRVYPDGNTFSHIVGHVNIDNLGIAGIEKWIDNRGLADLHRAGFGVDREQEPIRLGVDMRVQHALRDKLVAACEEYDADAAAGVVLNVRTGEIVAMVSEPDYDPNNPREALDPNRINRLTTGVYEMGSAFKALTIAMALDSGKVTLNSSFDARGSLRYRHFSISNNHAENRVLTVPEIFTHSSNVGAAKIALAMGVENHKAFLKKLGQLDRLRTELPESAEPIVPKDWGEVNTATIAFGHGLLIAPLQSVMGVAAVLNGGWLIPPTFLKRSEAEARAVAKRVVRPETSVAMRYLMRLNAENGTATKADVKGFYVGGKTGTAEKVRANGRYSKYRLMTDVMAVMPADDPRFLLLIMLDEPKPTSETKGFATSGWNAAAVAAKVIASVAPLLGLEPRPDLPPAERLILPAGRGP